MTELGVLLDNIWEIAPKIRSRQISPVEITLAAIAHAERMQPILNTFITLTPDEALQQAHELEGQLMKGEYLGPLHGVPIGVKDMFLTKGVRTTDGGKTREHYVPSEDAGVVERVRSAGAVILGKENMHELGLGFTSDNRWYGRVHNPWDVDRIAGGSSGGSAANVASFVTYGSIGNDGGGSIRMPSAACGIVGLKPTFGRITTRGGLEGPDPSTYHVGPHTRSVRDSAIMLAAMSGYDPLDPTTVPVPVDDYEAGLGGSVKTLVAGIPTNHFFNSPLDKEIERAVARAVTTLEGLGVTTRPVEIYYLDTLDVIGSVADVPYGSPYEATLRNAREEISEPERFSMLTAQFILARDVVRGQQLRRRLQEEFARVMRHVDFLVSPTMPVLPWRFDEKHIVVDGAQVDTGTLSAGRKIMGRNTAVANFIGAPAISLPCGYSASGLPIGLQLIGRPWDDGLILRVAYHYEQRLALQSMIPPAVSDALGAAAMAADD